jgi:hypothetical protein
MMGEFHRQLPWFGSRTKTADFPKNSKEASVVEMALSHMPVSEL